MLTGQVKGLDCPEWLYALRHVKVRLDNFAGIPLLDLLGDLHTQRSHSGIPEAIPTPVGLLEPSD